MTVEVPLIGIVILIFILCLLTIVEIVIGISLLHYYIK
jgi:hypothetical protein